MDFDAIALDKLLGTRAAAELCAMPLLTFFNYAYGLARVKQGDALRIQAVLADLIDEGDSPEVDVDQLLIISDFLQNDFHPSQLSILIGLPAQQLLDLAMLFNEPDPKQVAFWRMFRELYGKG